MIGYLCCKYWTNTVFEENLISRQIHEQNNSNNDFNLISLSLKQSLKDENGKAAIETCSSN